MTKQTTVKINGTEISVLVHYYIKNGQPIIVTVHDVDGDIVSNYIFNDMSDCDHNFFIDELLNN